MHTTDTLAALDAHQTALLAALDHALALTRSEPEAARVDLARARWELLRRARAYQLFKHAEIFDPGILRGDPAQSDVAARMKSDCIAAGEGIEAFAVEWTGKDLVAEWPAFRAALDTIASNLRRHVACERRTIAAILVHTSVTRRPAPEGIGPSRRSGSDTPPHLMQRGSQTYCAG